MRAKEGRQRYISENRLHEIFARRRNIGTLTTYFRIQETLDNVALTKMQVPEKGTEEFDYLNPPLATEETLTQYDAFLFGVPTRYGNMPAQWKVRITDLLSSQEPNIHF